MADRAAGRLPYLAQHRPAESLSARHSGAPDEPLTARELDALRGALYPEITLTKSCKSGPRRIILDITQEQLAKKADSGHTIVRGIAGSGNSLTIGERIAL